MLPALRLLAKNLSIVILPLTGMIAFYLLIFAALLTLIPANELINFAGNTERIKEFVMANPVKTLAVFLLFGIIGFVLLEFFNAALIGSSIELAMHGSYSLSSAFDYGFLYTPRLVALDLFCSLALVGFVMPLLIVYFISNSKIAYFLALISAFLATPLVTMPRFVLVARDCGVFDAISEGFGFAIRNYARIMATIAVATAISLLSVFGLAILAVPIANSLMSVWLSLIYVENCKDVTSERGNKWIVFWHSR